MGRPINAITKTDWEGIGVEPDVNVSSDEALKTAHRMALEKQEQTLPDEARGLRNEVSTTLRNLREDLASAASPAISVAPAPLISRRGLGRPCVFG